ncbi:MAG: 4-hydroxy-3-methylbut-2-enyl diphosphate reductase [Desulfovibrio sp.]|jgi:4-hydroxy-3-methylbut-2-enyl diphosphate reductase|nr:4-hydroxy-3-methylbut-2-enyl diphosphate reductase [Desulfovibrio sp.]
MRVIRARTAGFCLGVSLALRRLDQEVAAFRRDGGQRLFSFGPIIHNPSVISRYADLGVEILDAADRARPGDRVVIRAHGLPRSLEADLAARGAVLADATCPRVKKAQLVIADQSAAGRVLLLFGEAEHPEVRGLLSYAGESLVFGHPDEAAALPLREGAFYALAAQTTQDQFRFEQSARLLSRRLGPRLTVLRTICDATRRRQREAVLLAKEVDLVIVVGGLNSGNTRRLAEEARAQGACALHVEGAADLPLDRLRGRTVIGLTAGASTPESQIDEVRNFLETL